MHKGFFPRVIDDSGHPGIHWEPVISGMGDKKPASYSHMRMLAVPAMQATGKTGKQVR